ncbi:hypothetical protein SERLA73DRAFT_178654 [Serpula lacrymans var. lacrymans S7.3]|uniref:NADH:flavin oxidoreductase/NADH oxidase N-terminal domain-containing protein n=2 Tax=Serpula lacrymans var. lacrymans TaxID=341189 RepID=F8PSD2_SERL3|nr:uncharacterized protein SERLADRAFT_463216 [Serpula lacrymans var. lacrymans S7.9]EGO00745.1 hypothetical protein SERLA73DRAFT_178654 [Serpula lacrymans var. lacrymans S7.3]EGO26309.1 hypothetical protein SERLADRAFT_463216 [Serpula lacrymans var. lacrymans S7.9]
MHQHLHQVQAAMSSSSSASDVSSILQPLTIGQLILRNRITMAALTRSRSVPTNVPNDINLEYYVQRARGGTGLIVSEGTLIVQQGTEWQNAPGLWSNEQVLAWKKITDAVHAEGGLIFAQLWHLGRSCHPDAPEQLASGKPVYAPSAVAARGGKFRFLPGEPGFVTPTAIDDPRVQIEEFKQAAIHAREAGFDGVELHGAGGYLVHQFLDSTSNIRTDSWGGSIENRCRFGLEALKELVSIWGNKKVAVKLDPSGGYNDMGMPLQETLDTFRYFITEADKLDLAYISLVRYTPGRDVMYDGKLRNTPHDVLASYRPFIKRSALFLNGGLTPSEAATLVASGQIDAAVFGRLFIGHPDIAKRLERGLPLDAKMDYTRFYGHGPHLSVEEQRRGYSDYSEVTL